MRAPQLLKGVPTAGSSRPSPPEVRNIQSDHDRRDRAKPPRRRARDAEVLASG
jgi:hypothetical protein